MMSRLQKSGEYYYQKLKEEIYPKYKSIQFVSDNSSLEEKLDKQIEDLKKAIYIKGMTFKSVITGFETQKIITARANAEIEYERGPNKSSSQKSRNSDKPRKSISELLKEVKHKELYDQLEAWRSYTASEYDAPPSLIITIRGMIELSNVMPRSLQNLRSIQDMGKKRIEKHGETILGIIEKYCSKYELTGDYLDQASKKTGTGKKKRTEIGHRQKESVDMYLSGKKIKEIAEERSLAESTIFSHLAEGIRWNLLDISKFMDKTKLDKAVTYFEGAENLNLTPAINALENEYSYGELRMVVSWIGREKKD